MPDKRGILLPCKAKKRGQYFVYCKVFQRSRPAKGPLRRCRMVVNTGSYNRNARKESEESLFGAAETSPQEAAAALLQVT